MEVKEPERVVLMCGGKKCCPEAYFNADSSMDLIDQDDGRDERIHLSEGQARALYDALAKRYG